MPSSSCLEASQAFGICQVVPAQRQSSPFILLDQSDSAVHWQGLTGCTWLKSNHFAAEMFRLASLGLPLEVWDACESGDASSNHTHQVSQHDDHCRAALGGI